MSVSVPVDQWVVGSLLCEAIEQVLKYVLLTLEKILPFIHVKSFDLIVSEAQLSVMVVSSLQKLELQ